MRSSQGGAQLGVVDRLLDKGIGPGTSGQETVCRPVEENDGAGPVARVCRLADCAHDCHATHGPHLHVDYDRIEVRPGESLLNRSRVADLLDLKRADREGRPNFIGHPAAIGDDENGGHGRSR